MYIRLNSAAYAYIAKFTPLQKDQLVVSSDYGKVAPTNAISTCAEAEYFVNAVAALTHPAQYALCKQARRKNEMIGSQAVQNALQSWPSIFTGASWIFNRLTPRHRDGGGLDEGYDYLTNFGSPHLNCYLDVPDIGISLQYRSRGIVALLGRPLSHQVQGWTGGDRVCVARWIKSSVVDLPLSWPVIDDVKKVLGLMV